MASGRPPANIRAQHARHNQHQKANFELEVTLSTKAGKPVSLLKFSPSGEYLAAVLTNERQLRMWDFKKRDLIKIITEPNERISCLAWSPDSSMFVTGNFQKNLLLWDTSRGKSLRQLKGHTAFVFACTFNPNGTLIASSSHDKTIRIWDVRTGVTIISLKCPELVTSLSFNSCGDLLATTCVDGKCRILELASGLVVKKIRNRARYPMTYAKFCPNRMQLITTSFNEDAVKLWDIRDGTVLKSYVGHQYPSHSADVNFCHDGGPWIVSGSRDRRIYVWNFETTNLEQTLDCSWSEISCTSCHPTEPVIASGGINDDHTIKVWRNRG